MLKLNRSLTTNKSNTKFNSIQSESKELSKKRSFSLRKINQPKELINCSPDFSKRPFQQVKEPKVQQNQVKQKQVEQMQLDLLKSESQNSSPRKSRYNIFNVSKLSPIKQYETKLKISAESWLVFDYRKDSYKRGWKPAQIAQYSGLVRLIVFKAYTELLKKNPEIKNFNMRVNTNYLKQEIQMRKQEKAPQHKKKGVILRESISRVFDNNIVINIVDLLYGLLMTNYDDILEYAIIFVGYLCHCQATQTNPVPQDSPCHFIQKASQACTNGKYFGQYLHTTLFPSLQMNSSSFNPDIYLLSSTANDIARLYLSIQSCQLFKQIIQCKQITCKIKYQIGFKYWENRILVFKNRRIDMGSDYQFISCWKGKKNYSVLSRNIRLDVLVVLQDCKFGMAQCDIYHVEEWVRELMRPIVDHRKTHAKLLPLLRNSQNSPPKAFRTNNRLKTDKQEETQNTK